MGLFEELSQTYPLENVHPYGAVLIIPKENFQPEWEQQLKNENVQVYTNSWNRRVCFFLRKKLNAEAEPASEQSKPETKPRRLEWNQSDVEALKNMRAQGLSLPEIARRLNRPKASVMGKLRVLKASKDVSKTASEKQTVENKLEVGSRSGNEALFNEFLSAAQTLFPKFRRASAVLLKEAVRVLEAS